MEQWVELLLITSAAFLAGLIDSIVGGGGLVLVPALFSTFPHAHPATLFGTNKGASVWGTAFATLQYSRRVVLPWRVLLPAAVVCGVASLGGAWAVTRISPAYFRQALPFILALVLIYTVVKKELGQHHQPRFTGGKEVVVACAIGGTIGFYDGFFGPGTGSFFVFLLVRVLGYDFLHASAGAKLLNFASNLTAIALFAAQGHIWWHLVAGMAVANVLGSWLGTRLALQHGTVLVRRVFIGVVLALIAKISFPMLG